MPAVRTAVPGIRSRSEDEATTSYAPPKDPDPILRPRRYLRPTRSSIAGEGKRGKGEWVKTGERLNLMR